MDAICLSVNHTPCIAFHHHFALHKKIHLKRSWFVVSEGQSSLIHCNCANQNFQHDIESIPQNTDSLEVTEGYQTSRSNSSVQAPYKHLRLCAACMFENKANITSMPEATAAISSRGNINRRKLHILLSFPQPCFKSEKPLSGGWAQENSKIARLLAFSLPPTPRFHTSRKVTDG